MCLIVYSPGSEEIDFDEEHFDNAWSSNPHGVGFMWTEDGRVRTKKTRDRAKGKRLFKRLKDKVNLGIHFRFRTSGATDINNVHPFQILTKEEDGIDLFMMHNGVLSVHEPKAQFSDTWHFARNYLRPILKHNWEFLLTAEFDDLISPHIKGSKLLFVYANDKYEGEIIFNKKDGWDRKEGTWVSNQCFLTGSRYYGGYYGNDYCSTYDTYKMGNSSTNTEAATKKDDGVYTVQDLFNKEEIEENEHNKEYNFLNHKRSLHLEELEAEQKKLDIVQDLYSEINNVSEAKLEEILAFESEKVMLLIEVLKERGVWEDFGMELMDLMDEVQINITEYQNLLAGLSDDETNVA